MKCKAIWSGCVPFASVVHPQVSKKMILEKQRSGTCLKNGAQTSLENFLTDLEDGDYSYLRDNGMIVGFDMDDSMWKLDEDGNWPEAEA